MTLPETGMDIGEEKLSPADGSSKQSHINLPASETGIRMGTEQPQARMLVVLSAEELAAAITKAHGVKMSPDDFALKSAKAILEILPALYHEPRNG